MFSTGMRVEEGFCFLNSDIQAKVLLDRLTQGIYSMLPPLKVNVNCTVVIILLLYGCEMRTNYGCHLTHFKAQFRVSSSTPATNLLRTDLGLRLI